METHGGTEAGTAAITAAITYAVDTGEKPVNETFGPNNIRRRNSGAKEQRPMPIRDGRPLAGTFSLDRNGFAFVPHPTAVADFFDKAELAAVYYPEVERLVREVSGAARVVVFDHTLRSGDEAEREARLVREPVLSAHNDYTEWSGPQRVREILPDEADALLAGRFAIIQVWRAINQPIRRTRSRSPTRAASPSATSSLPSAAIRTGSARPTRCATTRTTAGSTSPRCGATRRSSSRCTTRRRTAARGSPRTPRSSIRTTPPGAPPRQSIEARTLAFFG